ncbi:hypothetical protein [Shewanella xiamenensis]|uniref:hypothetical protein n=1 Tax=Shewanella xiamenensis TaxID=332186 RepID=UPI001F0576CF|nr:hypothetical protein [Shewanella xiamenensis]UML95627.1 hypothetical protein MKD32_10195 [Shewanella xiamenensis]
MKKVIFILGVEAAKGVGKTSGRPYEFGKIFNLTPVRNWETEKGRSSHKRLYCRRRKMRCLPY